GARESPPPRTTGRPAKARPAGPAPAMWPPRLRPSTPAATRLRAAGWPAPGAPAACAREPARPAGSGSSARGLQPGPHQPPVGEEPFPHSIELVFAQVKLPEDAERRP